MCYVKHLKPKISQLDEIDGLQTLPANILADIYLSVSIKRSYLLFSFRFTANQPITQFL